MKTKKTPMTESRTIPDDQMDLLTKAFDAAWEASMGWNRGLSWEPAWEKFLAEEGLTECYADWKSRHPVEPLFGPPDISEAEKDAPTCIDCSHRDDQWGICTQRFDTTKTVADRHIPYWKAPPETPACELFQEKNTDG